MKYLIKPLLGINDILLGMSTENIISRFGEPNTVEEDYGYKYLVYDFLAFAISPDGQCDEIKIENNSKMKFQVYLDDRAILGESFNEIADFLKTLDPNPDICVEDYASSLKLGIAISGTRRSPIKVNAVYIAAKGHFEKISSMF